MIQEKEGSSQAREPGAVADAAAASRVPTWRRIRLLIGDRASSVLILIAASVISALSEAGVLAIAAQAATALVDGHTRIRHLGPLHLDISLNSLLLVGLGLAVLRLALQGATSYYSARIAGDVQAGMRRRLFEAYTVSSWTRKSQDREGHFQELMTNQVMLSSQGAVQAALLIISAFTFTILAASAFALSAVVALAVLGVSALLFGALRPLTRLGARLAKRLSAAQLAYAGAVGEANSVAEETEVFGVRNEQIHRIQGFIFAARGLFIRTQLLARLVPNLYQSVVYLILVAGLIVLSSVHPTNFPSLGAVVLLLVRAGSYGQQLQTSYQLVRQSMPYAERVQEATEQYAGAEDSAGKLPLDTVRLLTFGGVCYAYPGGRTVLRDISFQVGAAETIGIVGPSGAGKSTLVQILLRLRRPTHGGFLVNGVPANQYSRRDWNRCVSYVPQQPRLIYGTVAENVRLFRDIDDAAVERACHLARIHDEVMTWPAGYQTIIGPRARAISGGQQQRICLARALAARPELLVLDEPTSALDPRSEAMIQESLAGLRNEIMIFIVAHRMSTLSICDRVMVIVNGRLDGFERIDVLSRSNDYFRSASSLAVTAAH